MTNTSSTVSNPPAKGKKKVGPIRWGGFVPTLVLVGGLSIYFLFFFDGHLRRLLQYGGGQLFGARVDIARVKTSFFNGSFEMNDIEVANRNSPMKNLFQIGRVHFRFMFAPLLKKKLVVNDMGVESISYGTVRKISGALPPSQTRKDGGMFDAIADRVGAGISKQFKESPLQNLDGLLSAGQVTGKVQALGENSASFKRVREVESQINQGASDWKKISNDLPSEQTVQGIKGKVEQIANSKPSNVEQIASTLNQVQSVKSEIDGTIQKVKTVQDTVTRQIDAAGKAITSVDEAMQADVANVRKTLKIPDLSFQDLTPYLLGPQMNAYVTRALYWSEMSRKYLPKKKPDAAAIEHERARGTDFHFGGVAAYPAFLVYRTDISSNVSEKASQGRLAGEILGINSDPPVYGKPTTASLKADFPDARISGAAITAIIDHVGENPTESANMTVASIPVEDWTINESPFLLRVKRAVARTEIDFKRQEDKVHGAVTAQLANVDYELVTDNKKLEALIQRVIQPLRSFQLKATVDGTLSDLKFYAASDLGERLGKGIQAEFQAQIAAAEAEIKKQIEGQVQEKKKALVAKFEATKAQALAPIQVKINQVNQLQTQVDQAKQRLESEKNKLVNQQVQKGADEIKKKLKLPGF